MKLGIGGFVLLFDPLPCVKNPPAARVRSRGQSAESGLELPEWLAAPAFTKPEDGLSRAEALKLCTHSGVSLHKRCHRCPAGGQEKAEQCTADGLHRAPAGFDRLGAPRWTCCCCSELLLLKALAFDRQLVEAAVRNHGEAIKFACEVQVAFCKIV